MLRVISFLSLILMGAHISYGQELEPLAEIRQIYDYLNSVLDENPNDAIHMETKTEIEYEEENATRKAIEYQDIKLDKNVFILKSKQIEVFKDPINTVSVYHQPKNIQIIDSPNTDFQNNALEKINENLNRIIGNTEDIQILNSNPELRKIRMFFKDSFSDFAKCKYIEMEYSISKKQIISICYVYKDGQSVKTNKSTFLEYEIIPKPNSFSESALSRVFDQANNLNQQYQSYELFDHRKNQRHE